jgi:hypothetical protein
LLTEAAVKTVVLLLTALLLASTAGLALEITSIVPSRAAPATPVILTGGPFSAQSRIFLGEHDVAPTQVLAGQLEFLVPALPAGSYSLTVQDDREVVLQPFTFEVLAPLPEITVIEPNNLDVCADVDERLVQVEGRNFLPNSSLLLNGNAVSSRVVNDGTMEFQLPELPAGVYGVAVHNPDGTTSLPHALWVNSVPEITSVDRGEEFVNHYEMVIHGKNFFYNSILVINEPRSTGTGVAYRQLTFNAGRGGSADWSSAPAAPGEKLLYSNCRTLVYHRYPINQQDKELTLLIINPDGKKTSLFPANLP